MACSRRGTSGVLSVFILVGAFLSAVFVIDPFLGVILGVGLLGMVLAVEPRNRLPLVVLGWMATFGYSAELSAVKFAFIGFCVVVAGLSTLECYRFSAGTPRGFIRAAMTVAGAIGVVSLLAWVVGVIGGANPVDASRDSAAYLLFAVTIPVAVEAGVVLRRQTLVRLIVACGLLSALSFFVTNTSARGVNQFSAFTPWLGSLLLAIPVASMAFARAVYSRGLSRALWWSCFLFVTGLVLASGTRTGLILLAPAAVVSVVPATHHARRSTAIALLTASIAGIYLSLVTVFSRLVDPDFIAKRLGFLLDFSIDAFVADRSAQWRVERYYRALSYFKGQPVLGKGFGTITAYERLDETQAVSFYLDTPLLVPAKFGIVGTVALAVCVFVLAHVSLGWCSHKEVSVDQLAILGFMAGTVAALPLSAVLEDKGYVLGLCLVLALGISVRPKNEGCENNVLGPNKMDAARRVRERRPWTTAK